MNIFFTLCLEFFILKWIHGLPATAISDLTESNKFYKPNIDSVEMPEQLQSDRNKILYFLATNLSELSLIVARLILNFS